MHVTDIRAAARAQLGDWVAKRVNMIMLDLDLLNRLAQPTAHAKTLRRYKALNRYLELTHSLAMARLEGIDVSTAKHSADLIEKYQAMYQFTKEECDARIEENIRLRF